MENNPEVLIKTHLEYIKAGASCITTASYQASIKGLQEIGYTKDKAEQLILSSVDLVETAIQQALDLNFITKRPFIAGSIGPYGAYLADGSEYRGDYGISDSELIEFHQGRIGLLDISAADILACETIPSIQEGKVLSDLLSASQKPSWISFSCQDGQHLNDGSKISETVSLFKNHPNVFAVGANCTNPSFISEIILTIKKADIDKKIIVYPNSGEAYNAKTKKWMGLTEPISFIEMTEEWRNLGADIIGGCCRIGPDHIHSLVENTSKN